MSKYPISLASSIGIRPSVSPEMRLATDWQRLWRSIASTERTWRTLALVPGGPGVAAETYLQIAAALAETGTRYLRTPVHVANAMDLEPTQVTQFWEELNQYMGSSTKMIVAVSALSANASSLPLAKGADGALLCLLLGEISNPDARETLAQVGAPHFLGSAVFRLPVRVPKAAKARKV
ncbi:MAG: hypothetical protein RLZZ450_341 [Pseudomonadota bacterium]|jgi:hypothetical protein